MCPDVFYYKGIRFDRQRHLENYSLIYSNHIYFAKWDETKAAQDFKEFYDFLVNECEPDDIKYFVATRRIRVPEIRGVGYGYLQDKLEYVYPRDFDGAEFNKTIKRLQTKYHITDFSLGHNIGFLDGQPKIYDIDVHGDD